MKIIGNETTRGSQTTLLVRNSERNFQINPRGGEEERLLAANHRNSNKHRKTIVGQHGGTTAAEGQKG